MLATWNIFRYLSELHTDVGSTSLLSGGHWGSFHERKRLGCETDHNISTPPIRLPGVVRSYAQGQF